MVSSINSVALEALDFTPTPQPTPYPTKTPTPSPTKFPTNPIPTKFPTFAPTKEPLNPSKPVFDETQFDISTMIVGSVGSVTLAPTTAPTPSPTFEGYAAVLLPVVVQVVEVAVTFPLTPLQAADPVMKKSLADGFAKSLGFDPSASPDAVRVSTINGLPARRLLSDGSSSSNMLRRLNNHNTDIGFEVESASSQASQVEQLKTNIAAAATEGSLVANVQKEAATNGVLTTELKSMARVQTVTPVATQKTVQKLVQARTDTPQPTKNPTNSPTAPTAKPTAYVGPTPPPTKFPTAVPTKPMPKGLEDDSQATWWGPALFVFLCCCCASVYGVYRLIKHFSAKKQANAYKEGSDGPVTHSKVEDALGLEAQVADV